MTSPKIYTRREFVQKTGYAAAGVAGLSAFGPLLAACGDSGGDLATVTTQLSWLMNVEFAGEWVADDQGYYADENITPNWITGGPNAPRAEGQVVGGQADVGMSTFMETTVRSIIEGGDIKIFAAEYQHSPLALMSDPEGRTIRTAQDMIGARLGGPPFLQGNVDSLFRANGLPLDYEFVPVGGTDPQPILDDQIDAMYVFITNQALIFEDMTGRAPVLLLDSDNNFDAYSSILFARQAYIDDNRDALVRYLRGTIKGWERNLQEPELGARLAVDVFGKDLGLDYDQQLSENNAQNMLVSTEFTRQKGLLWIDRGFIENSIFPAFAAGGLTDIPTVDEIADFSILEEAYDGATSLLG
jgi:ABC-type nitrate/sulfonate/bicarbonate transport system substrate-binding protein